MRRVYAAAEVPTLSVSHWRQICASIVKMKFGADRRCFESLTDDIDRDEEDDDDDSEEADVATFSSTV